MRIFARRLVPLWLALWLQLALGCFPGAIAATGDFSDIPPLKARVTDTTGTLSAQDVAGIEMRLKAFEQTKGSQLVVLMVPTTQPEAIEQYAIRVAEAWKIGRKGVNDGVILVVAKNDRKLRIEVGYGLEGALPDAVAKRIIAEVITPHFRNGDFAGGIRAGVEKITAVAGGEELPPPTRKTDSKSLGDWTDLLMFGVFALFVGGMVLRSIFGRFLGSAMAGGIAGAAAWFLVGGLILSGVIGVAAFLFALIGLSSAKGSGLSSGGWTGSSGGGGWSSSGGSDSFSGGGGDFGGGGASGDW